MLLLFDVPYSSFCLNVERKFRCEISVGFFIEDIRYCIVTFMNIRYGYVLVDMQFLDLSAGSMNSYPFVRVFVCWFLGQSFGHSLVTNFSRDGFIRFF